MPETTRIQLAVYAIALCAIAWLGARYLSRDAAPAPASSAAVARQGAPAGGESIELAEPEGGGGLLTVHVAGAVQRPGVYRLKDGARVQAAVRLAGGATRRAELDGLNLAAKVQDGRQIVVPRRGAPGGASAATGVGVGAAAGVPSEPIDLNLATLEQLDTLEGVGPATAKKILDYREEHGGFGSVEELGQVSGIGEKRLATLRDLVHV